MIRKCIFVFTIIILYCSECIWAQPSPRWPVEMDYTNIELKLLLKGSNGKAVVFDKKNKDKTLSSKKGYCLESVFIKYCLGAKSLYKYTDCPKFQVEMEGFYERIYRNYPDDYIDRIKKILTAKKYNTFPYCSDNYNFERKLYFELQEMSYENYECIPVDTICYKYAASDNIVYEKDNFSYDRTETPYFIPIGDVEIMFTEESKMMHIVFELYDYKKLGFSRLEWSDEDREIPHIDLFMEIHFQEGDFVVTDESYPNLIKKE